VIGQDVSTLYFAALTRITAAHVSVTSTQEPVVSGITAFARARRDPGAAPASRRHPDTGRHRAPARSPV